MAAVGQPRPLREGGGGGGGGGGGRRDLKRLIEVAPGFYNVRGKFTLLGGLLNLGTHMSLCLLQSGKYLVIDTIKLDDEIRHEICSITDNGKLIEAVIATHPYHTLAFRDFFAAFPHAPYYGTPRHLDVIKDIPWKGEIMANKSRWEPEIEMRIPDGSEFVLPLPPKTNHFSNVFVLHKASKTIHNDDCVLVWNNPPLLLKIFGFRDGDMSFHPSIKGPGLYPTCQAPSAFREWVKRLLVEWDFDNICTAHNGNCIGGAKEKLRATLERAEPLLEKLIKRNSKAKPPKDFGAWSTKESDPPECG
ncbi:hypothetical protein GUITHDRAFT_82993 [Guillardia theta CCMP2712]|uniref:Metallo-beta-lactamase domain-containing protein n=1 Tax=Guillardia theta (strain CCMP2712) TaxID=905079 RepID=L1I6S6_GUITC|nr:hypothetical protein GUITHDRAFT_82993 [Guillardia theta CCMP2712]EKX31589.1 hypothetical protein GUITHDRAFT_82993 [Guillardia theta CCMP2712]|eukprot:XP_005818569.1 hypothetical protein GUITHDRAFT_82993 [Guillardia theta CCMP2712]